MSIQLSVPYYSPGQVQRIFAPGGSMANQIEQVEVDRIFLFEDNPRHEPLRAQDEIIAHLCKDEQVFNLARSISEFGPNPLEVLGLIQIGGSGKGPNKKNYQVWEGNRRVCAVKLLNDPDLAPPHLRKDIEKLASLYSPIKRIAAVVFDDRESLKLWMGIIHGGQQSGIGRKDWNAEQKERHTGSGRNRIAQAILDQAQALGLISKEERSGKITTAQRFLNNGIVKEALGIDATNPEDITYNRPLEDFSRQLARFIEDLKSGVAITSRHNKEQIDQYGRKLAKNKGLSDERIEPQSLNRIVPVSAPKRPRKTPPKKPKAATRIEYDKRLNEAISSVGSQKLESIYYSICAISLEDHTPLIAIGVWAFVESLTALAGRQESVDFCGYYSNQRLSDLGFSSGRAGIRQALDRIRDQGNSTKHHDIAASFNGKQLSNDLATVMPLLLKTTETIAAR
jgi:hypothetical protein